MDPLLKPRYNASLQNLRIALRFIEAYFRYLPYERTSDLAFSITFYGQDADTFSDIDQLIHHLTEVIMYQKSENMDIDIVCDLNVRQTFRIGEKDIELFYYGQPLLYHSSATVLWNCNWDQPSFEIRLENPPSYGDLLILQNNVHIAITRQIESHE